MHQWNGAVHPLARGVSTPPCFIIHNLNHVSAFSYSCFVLPWLAIAYRSLHLTPHWCWLINIRDSVFFYIRFVLRTNHFLSVSSRQTKFWFWDFPPPGLVSHFLVFSLFYLQLTCNPSWLHFSQLASPACLFVHLCVSLCSLWLYGWVGLKGRVCVR